MRKITLSITLSIMFLISLNAQNNVGIGIVDPLAKLHIHGLQPGGFLNALRISTSLTDSTATDGLLIQTILSGAVNILNYENAPLALGTSGSTSLYLMPDQKLGYLTPAPDSAFSINNLFQVGAVHGDLIFTNDLASITFPTTTLPNSPMIQMFALGNTNADRMVIAHSSANPTWGLQYKDNVDEFRFGVAGASSTVSIGVSNGHMGIGETGGVAAQSLLIAATSNDVTAGHFINTRTSALPVNGVYSSISGSGSGDKRAGFFESILGNGRAYGVYATSVLADTNIAVYGSAGFFGGQPDDLNRAAWFDDGDVVVDDQMIVGSSALSDVPHESALLELNSTTRGLLLPRMSAAQRLAISPSAEGLLVYDTDSAAVFIRKGASWGSLSGGIGGSTIWSESGSPSGPYVSDLAVGIGDTPQFFKRMYVKSGTGLPYAIDLVNDYSGGLGKYGLRIETSSAGTNTRYGIYSKAWASIGNDVAYGIYAEGNQGTTAATVYGIYASAPGTGSGDRWAGYFNGNAKITDEITVEGDQVKILPTGYFDGSLIQLADADGTPTIWLRGNQSPLQGSVIVMADAAGNHTLQLDAENPQGGSQLILSDELANTRIYMRSKEAVSEGPDFRMFNSSNALSLEIDGDVAGNGSGAIDVYDEDGTRTYMLRGSEATGQGSAMKMYDAAGNLTIELDADFGGDGRVITDELEIKGGSDLAEYFETSETTDILPGQVVVIDTENPGQVKLSKEAYDKKVVGIASGANGIQPGMLMGQRGSIAFGDLPIAIAGRVYVQVDETSGAIEPGDFLTTSNQAGKAMLVDDWEKSRGSILGKALTAPDENSFVLILVHLQ